MVLCYEWKWICFKIRNSLYENVIEICQLSDLKLSPWSRLQLYCEIYEGRHWLDVDSNILWQCFLDPVVYVQSLKNVALHLLAYWLLTANAFSVRAKRNKSADGNTGHLDRRRDNGTYIIASAAHSLRRHLFSTKWSTMCTSVTHKEWILTFFITSFVNLF